MSGQSQESIKLDGALTLQNVGDISATLQNGLKAADRLEVECSQVTACDCAGVQLLLAAFASSEKLGTPVSVKFAGSDAIATALDTLGVLRNDTTPPRFEDGAWVGFSR